MLRSVPLSISYTRHFVQFVAPVVSKSKHVRVPILVDKSTFFISMQHRNKVDLNTADINSPKPETVESDVDKYNEVIEILMNVLKLEFEKCKFMFNKFPKLKSFNVDTGRAIVEFLGSKGVTPERISKVPWVLLIPVDLLSKQLHETQRMLQIDDASCALAFTQLSSTKMLSVSTVWKWDDKNPIWNLKKSKHKQLRACPMRILYFAEKLQCSPDEIADLMIRVKGTMTLRAERVVEVVTVLLDGNVPPRSIIADPYVLLQTQETIQDRLRLLRHQGVDDIKPWVLRCSQDDFDTYVNRWLREKALLEGHRDIRSYLQEQLRCGRFEVGEILLRVPSVKTATASKLHEMIEFLYGQGFTSDHILDTPRVLGHSVETVSKRLTELKTYGCKSPNLGILCRTNKDYKEFLFRVRLQNK